MRTHWLRITGGLVGTAAVLLMIFANQLGLESFPSWGVRRSAILLIGAFLLVTTLFYREDNFIGKILHSADGRFYVALMILNAGLLFFYL